MSDATHRLLDRAPDGGLPEGLRVNGPATDRAPDRFERLFVYGVYGAMVAGLLYYVWMYGRNVPFWDDWELVPVLSGRQPLSLAWLWSQQNEHRLPLARLVTFAVWRGIGDQRVVMVLTDLLVAAVTLALIRTTSRLRGRMSYTDAFFPLLFLHWGMFENLIFMIQLFFVAGPVLALTLMVSGLGRWHGRLLHVVAIGAAVVLLPLQGAIGMLLTPALLVYVAYLGVVRFRSGEAAGRRDGWVLLGACAATVAVMTLYMTGFERAAGSTATRTFAGVARTIAEVLSVSVGGGGLPIWILASAGTIAVVSVAATFAIATAYARPADRERALAVLGTMAAFVILIAAVGFGRSGLGPGQGLSDRYAIFAAPLLCCAYLSMSLFAPDERGRFVRVMLLLTMTFMLAPNTRAGIAYGVDRADRADALTAAIDAGASPAVASARNWERVYPDATLLADRLEMLRAQGSGPYRGRAAATAPVRYREVELPLEFVATHDVRLDDGVVVGAGADPYVVLALPAPEYVCGVRLEYEASNDRNAPLEAQLFWALTGHFDFSEGRRSQSVSIPVTDGTRETTVWIYDTIDRLRIDPDRGPCTFRLVRATLLLRTETP